MTHEEAMADDFQVPLGYLPTDKKLNMNEKFSFDTIKDFDKHIGLSIPNYEHVHELICSLSTYFIKKHSNVFDIGTSTGSLILKIRDHNKNTEGVNYVGIDTSDNLLPDTTKEDSFLEFRKADVTSDKVGFMNGSLVTSVFTLQFIPLDQRMGLLSKIHNQLNPGGAVIVCEKVFCKDGFMQDLFTFSYYDYKKKSFTEKEILDKQHDLREIMQPLSEEQNKIMWREVGFKNIETFFTSLFFKGWVLCK